MNRSLSFRLLPFLQGAAHKRGLIFGVIILFALLAFEVFNYSSTLFALTDILGNLAFGPLRWAAMLAFAFCAIDFAGIARIFTPEQGRDEGRLQDEPASLGERADNQGDVLAAY